MTGRMEADGIEFCEACSGSISRHELENGDVLRVNGGLYHRACAPPARRGTAAWLPWLVILPAVAAGFLLGFVLAGRGPNPIEPDAGREESLRRMAELEGQVRGLSAQLQGTAEERRQEAVETRREVRRQAEALLSLEEDLDLLVETIEAMAESLARSPEDAEDAEEEEETAANPVVERGPDLATLLASVESDEFGRRFSALHALSLRPEPAAARAIRDALADGHRRIRAYAARLLGEIGDVAAGGDLVALLRDDDPVVRQAAYRALLLLSGMPYPYEALAPEETRREQAGSWEKWWHDHHGDGAPPPDDR